MRHSRQPTGPQEPAAKIRAARMEGLEGRMLYSATPAAPALPKPSADPAGVTLTRADGAGTPVSRKRDTWIIVHGLLSWKDAPGIKVLATAMDAASPDDQVLVADWRKLAITDGNGLLLESNATAAAGALARLIARQGLRASRINLVGFSMGGLVVDRLARALHDRGGVNAIVALDPSTPPIVDKATGKTRRPLLNLKADSRYSIAFHGRNFAAQIERVLTADDTVRIDNLPGEDLDRHAGVFDVFTNMTKINNTSTPDAASSVFSLSRIIAGQMPAWKKDQYDPIRKLGGYEAIITAKGGPGSMRPDVLTFVNGRGRVRRMIAE